MKNGSQYEKHVARKMKRRLYLFVRVSGKSGDYGADVMARTFPLLRKVVVQCKNYKKPVGVKAVQEAYAGRDYYDRMVGAVMTNQYFTAPAVEAAKKLKILLWDGGYIESMLDDDN